MPPDHIEEMKAEDPLPKLNALMLEHQFTQAELDAIVAKLEAEIEAAVEFAFNSPFPDADEILKDVFEEEIAA